MSSDVRSYNLSNEKRDLSDVLSTIIEKSPNFIRWFPLVGTCKSKKYEWLEEWVRPKTVAYSEYNQSTGVFTVASASGWAVGDYIHIKGDNAVLKVTATTDTTITVTFVATNGSDYTTLSEIPTTAGVLCYDSHPIGESSNDAPGSFEQSGTEYNTTQIFRRDIKQSGTALATEVYGQENTMEHQIVRTAYRIQSDINHALIFGTRNLRTENSDGLMAGLNYYGNQPGGLSVDANGKALDAKILNDAAMAVSDCGVYPTVILCSPIMCRVISAINHCQLTRTAQDTERGSFVAEIVNDTTGHLMSVQAEPELNESDVWVIDPSGFGLVNMNGRALYGFDSTGPADDAKRYTMIGEMTAQFKNAKQRLCRIKNLKNPRLALEQLDMYASRNYIVNEYVPVKNLTENSSSSSSSE